MQIVLHTLAHFSAALPQWLLSHTFHCWYGHRLSDVSARHHFLSKKKVRVHPKDFAHSCMAALTAAQLNGTEWAERSIVLSVRGTVRRRSEMSEC